MIRFEKLSLSEMRDDLLQGFIRYFETTKVQYLDDGKLQVKEDHFIESWDDQKLITISRYLRQCVLDGGIVIVGKINECVVAFGNLDKTLYFDTYIHLPYIHVSKPYRHLGYGKQLFNLLEEQARLLGGSALYLSTHPSVEAQAFYRKMGCILASKIIPHIYEDEPLDIQLEKPLKGV